MPHLPKVRMARDSDREGIRRVITSAFGAEEGDGISGLVEGLLEDESAAPILSLVAADDDDVLGHVLFTNARIEGPQQPVSAAILAPLSVHLDYQNAGIGDKLVREGLERLKAAGVALVFVLGHPGYYPRFGFSPAGRKGFEASYPIPPENADAWMVMALRAGADARAGGRVLCADTLDDPKYWRE